MAELWLGRDGSAPLHVSADSLTTHAVCVGMTGSGKTHWQESLENQHPALIPHGFVERLDQISGVIEFVAHYSFA